MFFLLFYALVLSVFVLGSHWLWGWPLGWTLLLFYEAWFLHSWSAETEGTMERPQWRTGAWADWLRRHWLKMEVIWQERKKEEEEQRPVVYAVLPHGMCCWTLGALFVAPGSRSQRFGRCRVLVHWFLTRAPLIRELVLSLGMLLGSTREAMDMQLAEGYSVALCPSGVEGKLMAAQVLHRVQDLLNLETGQQRVLVVRRSRHGFLKVCRQHGVRVVPVLAVDEHQHHRALFPVHGWFESLRLWLFRRLGGAVVWPCALQSLRPRPNPLTQSTQVVVGRPLDIGIFKTLDEAADHFYTELQRLGAVRDAFNKGRTHTKVELVSM